MSSYLITGASRGIGLELSKQLLDLPASQVSKIFAVTRSESKGVNDLKFEHGDRIVNVLADLSPEGVKKAVAEVETSLQGSGLDVLINNTGILTSGPSGVESVPGETLAEGFNVNVVGVQTVTAGFLPLLRKGKGKKVVNMSTTLGSTKFALGWAMGGHAYSVSKAALGMLNALYATEYAKDVFTFILISPGWLKTDMGSQYAHLEPEVGVAEVKRIILEAGPAQNGKFLNINVPGYMMPDAGNRPNDYKGGEVPF